MRISGFNVTRMRPCDGRKVSTQHQWVICVGQGRKASTEADTSPLDDADCQMGRQQVQNLHQAADASSVTCSGGLPDLLHMYVCPSSFESAYPCQHKLEQ